MTDNPDPEVTPQAGGHTGGAGPGSDLKAAREARGMSVEDVAIRLHLESRTISALEADRYEQLPAPIFVRGYLRNYARLVGLDEEALVERYGAQGVPEPSPDLNALSKRGGSAAALVWRALLWLAVIAVVAGALVFYGPSLKDLWPGTPAGGPESSGAPGGVKPQATPAPGVSSAPPPAAAVPTPPPGAEPASPPPTAPAPTPEPGVPAKPAPAAPTPVPGQPQDQAPAQEPPAAPEPAAPAPSGPPAGAGDQAPSRAPVSPSAPGTLSEQGAPAGAASVGAPQGTLTLDFHGDCWTEVRDADGTRLVFGLMHAGEHKQLHGRAPFSVVLGNASAVSIVYDGKPFDQSRYTRGNVARFQVGESR